MRWLSLFGVVLACSPSRSQRVFAVNVAVWGPLDPIGPASASASTYAQYWVYEIIGRFDAEGKLVPALASLIEPRGGGRAYVELRPDHFFSDGAPVTAADVERSLRANGMRMVPSGPGFIIERLQQALPLEVLLARSLIFREKAGRLLGSGPFAVAEQSDERIRLVRRHPVPNRIGEVTLISYPTPRDAFTHTLKGDANLIPEPDPGWVEFFEGVPRLRVVHGEGRQTDSIAFNARLAKSARIALAQAIGSNTVRDLAFGPGCAEARNRATPEAPVPPGAKLDILSWPSLERFALAVRRRLGERGGEILAVQPAEAVARAAQGKFDLIPIRALVWPPSMAALLWRTGSRENLVGYSNAAVDKALDVEDWRAAEAALRDDPPAAFVCTRDRLAVIDARIKDPTLGPYDLLETLPDWEVGE